MVNLEIHSTETENFDLDNHARELELKLNEHKTNIELSLLKKNVVERNKDFNGKKVFDYWDKTGQKREIVVGKEGNNKYSVRVKKRETRNGKEGRYTQKNGNDDCYYINANNKRQFNKGLSKILNETIGTVVGGKRSSLTKTGGRVYDELGTSGEKPDNIDREKIEKMVNRMYGLESSGEKSDNIDREKIEKMINRMYGLETSGEESDNSSEEKKTEDNKENKEKNNGYFWDNPAFFDSTQKIEPDNQYKDKGIELRRDVGVTFYVMKKEDIQYVKNKKGEVKPNRVWTINHLRKKLGALPEFSYLTRDEYEPKLINNRWSFSQTFNFRNDFASQTIKYPGRFFIPIPLDSKIRQIDDTKFKNYAKKGIEELCKSKKNKDQKELNPYKDYYTSFNKDKLAKFFTVIAKVETGRTSKSIGTDEYYRREGGRHDCYSFGPHHVLKNKGKGPGKTAYNKLLSAGYFSTEGQTYHPKNSTMRCMGFIVEKLIEQGKGKKDLETMLNKIFNEKNVTGETFKYFAKFYNGAHYGDYNERFAKARKNVA